MIEFVEKQVHLRMLGDGEPYDIIVRIDALEVPESRFPFVPWDDMVPWHCSP